MTSKRSNRDSRIVRPWRDAVLLDAVSFAIQKEGPDDPISIAANPSRVVVRVGGKIIVDTRDT